MSGNRLWLVLGVPKDGRIVDFRATTPVTQEHGARFVHDWLTEPETVAGFCGRCPVGPEVTCSHENAERWRYADIRSVKLTREAF